MTDANVNEQSRMVKVLAGMEVLEDMQAKRGNDKGLTKAQLLKTHKNWGMWKELVEQKIMLKAETNNSCHYRINRELIRKSFNIDTVKCSILNAMVKNEKLDSSN